MEKYRIDRKEFVNDRQWNISNALHMMKLSYAVYAGTTDNVPADEDWSITERLVIGAGYQMQRIEAEEGLYEANAMICWDESNIFLIFRGTEPTAWNQWATNVEASKEPFRIEGATVGKFHKGFAESVDIIWEKIVTSLSSINADQKKQLFVGGHSLGAGMSQIACLRLAYESPSIRPVAAYNFGSPRALNDEAASLYNELYGRTTYRVVNADDMVCYLPFKKMGYLHVGQLKYLSVDEKVMENPSFLERKIDDFLGLSKDLSKINPIAFITDHLPQHYTAKLDSINRSKT